MRGARLWLRPGHHLQGLIPACAGSTKRKAFFYKTASGSSPPVRGALQGISLESCSSGLIPACAGSTDGVQAIRVQDGAHPRLCGEHLIQVTHSESVAGSSPPVRGALPARMGQHRYLGLIPACAGSTFGHMLVRENDRAHPRPCGEHRRAPSRSSNQPGSSPPVRGALRSVMPWILSVGLIPARAGSTLGSTQPGISARAHPRPCGEHVPVCHDSRFLSGSSPPVRGSLDVAALGCGAAGLIPARAGSTKAPTSCGLPRRAHPRPCGEHRP